MKRILFLAFSCCLLLSATAQQSPNGKISVNPLGKGLCVSDQSQKALMIPVLGYEGDA